MRTRVRVLFVIGMALAGTTLLPSPAHAYIGPGAGLSAIGSLLALLAAAVVALFGFIWYPIKRALRALKGGRKSPGGSTMTAEARKP